MRHIDLSFSRIVGSIMNEGKNDAPYSAPYYISEIFKKINYAITNQCYLTLNYDDRQGDKGRNPAYGNPRDSREIIPYCLGISKKTGKLVLRPFHTSPNHTKKGPYEWKYMYLENMRNVRVARNRHFSLEDIPDNANPNGDKFMSKIINMVGMSQADREENKRYYNERGEFINPLTRVKQNPQNEPGAVKKPKTKSVSSLANLNIPQKQNNPGVKQPNYDYKAAQKNLQDFNKNYTQQDRQQRFADWDKAQAEAEQQKQVNKQGPITQNNMNDDEDFFTRPNNNE